MTAAAKYENPTRSDFSTAIRWGLFAIVVGFLLYLALHVFGVVGSVVSAPGRVVSKTLGTDNIITSYEWFFDANAQYEARVSQIKGHAAIMKTEPDAKERSRLNIELAAMRQSCRDLATKYNANADKANKAVFKTAATPPSINVATCEA